MKLAEFLNQPVQYMLGGGDVKGNKIGIELELEGRGVGLQDIATKGWQRHADGSLRGESVEFTTAGAKGVDEAKTLVAVLFGKFKENGVRFNDSIRTSTHVHFNFADKPIKHALNFFSLFTVLEEVLQYYSGEDRKGNLFCVSSREAEGIMSVLSADLAQSSLHSFAADRFKYAACNLSTLFKFGTVEVRTMRGANSAEMVNNWIDILNEIYEYSLKMKSPVDIVRDLSIFGAEEFMRRIFTKKSMDELMGTFPAPKTLHYSLMEGARLIQVFAYEFEEAFTAEVKVEEVKGEPLPFHIRRGRNAGARYCVYRPDGRGWNLIPEGARHLQGFWRDGQRVADCRSMSWSQARQRFVVTYPDGDVVECRWARHHEIPDEGVGPVGDLRAMPREPGDMEFMHDDEEEFFDDEN